MFGLHLPQGLHFCGMLMSITKQAVPLRCPPDPRSSSELMPRPQNPGSLPHPDSTIVTVVCQNSCHKAFQSSPEGSTGCHGLSVSAGCIWSLIQALSALGSPHSMLSPRGRRHLYARTSLQTWTCPSDLRPCTQIWLPLPSQ